MHPVSNMLIVAESDHAAYPLAERKATENGMDAHGVNPLEDVSTPAPLRAVMCMPLLLLGHRGPSRNDTACCGMKA